MCVQYIKASADIVVKYLLGVQESESALINFINAVLKDSGFELITRVTILNPFNFKSFLEDKVSILDIKAIDSKGQLINIEIQSSGEIHFKNRSLYYWSRLYSSEIKESELYKELDPVVCINLLGFELFPETEKIHTCFLVKEKDENFILTKHQELHFIELPKLKDKAASSQLEQWLVYFNYEGRNDPKSRKLVEEVLIMNPEIELTHKRYKKFTADEEMRELYEARVKQQRDVASLIDSGFERGKLVEKQQTLIRLMNKKFRLSEKEKHIIDSEKDPAILDEAIDLTLTATDSNEVLDIFNES